MPSSKLIVNRNAALQVPARVGQQYVEVRGDGTAAIVVNVEFSCGAEVRKGRE
jgi:hypothetical protein